MTHAVRPGGLQAERTALSWRRTSLALLSTALVLARVLAGSLGGWAIAPALLAAIFVVLMYALAAVRNARADRRDDGDLAASHAGSLTFVAMIATVFLATAVLVLVVVLSQAR